MTWLRRLRGEQSGFAISEVLASVVVVAVGIVSTLGVFDASGHSTLTAQRTEQALSIAQKEIEAAKAIDYSKLGLSAIPAHEDTGVPPGDATPNSPLDPFYYVSGGSLEVKADWYDDKSATLVEEPLVGGGTLAPGPEHVTSGQQGAEVYRFVTTHTESCAEAVADRCGTDPVVAKRITVAVVLDVPSGPRPRPVWLSTMVTDPDAGPPDDGTKPPTASPGNGPAVTAQPFFLHDTPCSAGARADITGSHATHDTGRTGATCASATPPDLMDTTPAPDGTDVPAYDYSSDLVRSSPAGLALKRAAATSCTAAPTSYAGADAATGRWSVHTWATPALAAPFTTPATGGRGAFSFWTRSVDGQPGAATVCLTLSTASAPNVPLVQVGHTVDAWPATWDQLSFAFDVPGFTVPAGDGLRLTLSVAGSSAHDVELMFDHPSYRSFLSLGTTTPVA